MNAGADIRITLLVENTARSQGLLGEHGLAVWIETGGRRVLLDTGQGMALRHNAQALGVDLSTADAVVLSHGHYDHVGGLEAVLEEAPEAALHLHPRATEAKFSGSAGGASARQASIPFVEQGGYASGSRRVVADATCHEVVPGVWVTGEIPRVTGFEDTGGPFFLDEAMTRPDPLLDDQAVFLPTPSGLIVICGCAHAGVINTLQHIEQWAGGRQPIRLLLGGLHLLLASPDRMEKTVAALRARQPERLVVCHCTGTRAACRLAREFPEATGDGHAGTVIAF